jgi:hypothetical protein
MQQTVSLKMFTKALIGLRIQSTGMIRLMDSDVMPMLSRTGTRVTSPAERTPAVAMLDSRDVKLARGKDQGGHSQLFVSPRSVPSARQVVNESKRTGNNEGSRTR